MRSTRESFKKPTEYLNNPNKESGEDMKGIISFYEKPGCRTNEEQKEILINAGYKLQVIDMLSKKWEKESLQQFFGSLKVHDCVNLKAPEISGGELDIHRFTEEELLDLMLEKPILIKRPLLFFRGEFAVGFENDLVAKLLEGEEAAQISCRKCGNQSHN